MTKKDITIYATTMFVSVLMTLGFIGYDVVANLGIPAVDINDVRNAQRICDSLYSKHCKVSLDVEYGAWDVVCNNPEFEYLESEVKRTIREMDKYRGVDNDRYVMALRRYFAINDKMACLQDSLERAYIKKSPEIQRIDGAVKCAEQNLIDIKKKYNMADSLRRVPRNIRFRNNCKKMVADLVATKTK